MQTGIKAVTGERGAEYIGERGVEKMPRKISKPTRTQPAKGAAASAFAGSGGACGKLSSAAVFIFFSAAAGAGIVAADLFGGALDRPGASVRLWFGRLCHLLALHLSLIHI